MDLGCQPPDTPEKERVTVQRDLVVNRPVRVARPATCGATTDAVLLEELVYGQAPARYGGLRFRHVPPAVGGDGVGGRGPVGADRDFPEEVHVPDDERSR